MRAEGYEIKRRGKSLEFKDPEQERFTRSFRLGEAYTEEALRERIADPSRYSEDTEKNGDFVEGQTEEPFTREPETAGIPAAARSGTDRQPKPGTSKRAAGGRPGTAKTKCPQTKRNVSLLVDIEAKMRDGKGKGYERWAKVFNLKEAANTLNFLAENGVADYAELAAKAAFDALGGKQIPKVAELNKEYAALLAEKKACYEEYKAARQEMVDYRNALQNVDKILGLEPQKKEMERQAQGKGRE